MMAADVGQFAEALDRVYKTFSTQDFQLEPTQASQGNAGLGAGSAGRRLETRFQQQLQRARAAFLQEFRNHSVVVESEVRRIREELVQKLEEKYGERMQMLREQTVEAAALVQRHKEEISQLRSLVAAQETYLTAVRHRWGLEQKDKLRAQVQQLQRDLEAARAERDDLTHQLRCRDELVSELGAEMRAQEAELKRRDEAFQEERRLADARLQGLEAQGQEQQKRFQEHLAAYEARFAEYRAKTAQELQLQDILNHRRCEALALMEEERQLHVKARTKPTPRIGLEPEVEERCEDYALAPTACYRLDDMGMDTSWRQYQLSNIGGGAPARTVFPARFRVERIRKTVGLNVPVSTEFPEIGPHRRGS